MCFEHIFERYNRCTVKSVSQALNSQIFMSWKVQPSRKPRKDGTCKLEIEYCYKGRNLPINIGKIYCKQGDWSEKTQTIVSGFEKEEMKGLNRLVEAAKQKMSHIINQAAIEGYDATHEYVKMMWGKPIIENNRKIEELLPLYEKWANEKIERKKERKKNEEGKKINTKELQTLPYLTEFAKNRGGLRVADVSSHILNEFCHYLCETGQLPEEKQNKRISKTGKEVVKGSKKNKASKKKDIIPFTNSSIRNHVKFFKIFFKEYLSVEGYNINQNFRDYKYHFRTPEVTDVIALTKKEFDRIFWLEIPEEQPHLRVAQVAFIAGTVLGGLRPSDLYDLDEKSFKTGNVKFFQQKTNGKVDNPLAKGYLTDAFLQEFLSYVIKYKDPKTGKMKRKLPSTQKVNDNLKVIAQMAGLDREDDKTLYYSGREVPTIESVNIRDHISLQYMRKSFVSILVEMGIRDTKVIADFTGHKDVNMIDHYLSIHDHTKEEILNDVLVPSENPYNPELQKAG